MLNEAKTDLEFPKAKAELEGLISELTTAVQSVHSELEVVKTLKKGGGGRMEWLRWILTILVIPLVLWAVSVEIRVSTYESTRFTNVEAGAMEARLMAKLNDLPTPATHRMLDDHEDRLRVLEGR